MNNHGKITNKIIEYLIVIGIIAVALFAIVSSCGGWW
jgi:hypothetical protein